jgi:hypothetical protein
MHNSLTRRSKTFLRIITITYIIKIFLKKKRKKTTNFQMYCYNSIEKLKLFLKQKTSQN